MNSGKLTKRSENVLTRVLCSNLPSLNLLSPFDLLLDHFVSSDVARRALGYYWLFWFPWELY